MDNHENKKSIVLMALILLAISASGVAIVSAKQVQKSNRTNAILRTELEGKTHKQSQLEKQLAQTQNQLQDAEKTAKSAQTKINNKSDNSQIYQDFNQTTEKLMKVLYTYSPRDFATRSDVAKKYLSDEALEEFFPKSGEHYGDNGSVTSKAKSIKIYNKTVQDNKINGLATAEYQARYKENDPNNGQAFYEVTYDTQTKKIIHLKLIDNKSLADDHD